MSQALKDLKLSEAQQGKVKDILDANQKKVRELMQKVQEGKVEREEIMDLHKKLMDNLLKEMKAALDEEQFKKFEAAIKENGPGPRGGPPGGGRPGADRNEGDQPPVRRPV